MSKSLSDLRIQWEHGLARVAGHAGKNSFVSVCAKGDRYWVYRYFKMGDNWEVSVDLSGGMADNALKAFAHAVTLAY